MEVDLQPFDLELAEPLRTADRTIEHRRGLLVRVRTEKRRGLGEATPLPGWTESYDDCRAALRRAADRLPLGGTEDVLAEMADTPAARHGLSLAVADLRARGRSVPLSRHLGGAARRQRIPVNATIGDGSVTATVDAAEAALEEGFDCLKCKVGARSLAEDVERLSAVRERVGPDVSLRADANGAWDRSTAADALEQFAPLSVSYVEQPLPAGDVTGHAKLRGGPVDVALDESLASADLDRLLDVGAADVFICKPMVLGGPDEAVRVARRARESGVRPVVSTTVDGVVARLGAVHVAAALAPLGACGLATADRLVEDLGPDPAPVVDGIVAVPRGAGTGLRLSEE